MLVSIEHQSFHHIIQTTDEQDVGGYPRVCHSNFPLHQCQAAHFTHTVRNTERVLYYVSIVSIIPLTRTPYQLRCTPRDKGEKEKIKTRRKPEKCRRHGAKLRRYKINITRTVYGVCGKYGVDKSDCAYNFFWVPSYAH